MLVNLTSMTGVRTQQQKAPIIRKVRMAVNILGNLGLLWVMLPYWPEVWLLLLLMVVAQGVYGTKKSTLIWGIACTVAMVTIGWRKGMLSQFWIPEITVYGTTYILIGLFVNRLVTLLKAGALPRYSGSSTR
jgi:hypothetical protein